MSFSIPNTSFCVSRDTDGRFHWQGNYRGMKVVAALPDDDSMRCLILLDIAASKEPTFENLFCIERSGKIKWKAELPESQDAFVSFEKSSTHLIANTWKGYRVVLNLETGKIVERQFTK